VVLISGPLHAKSQAVLIVGGFVSLVSRFSPVLVFQGGLQL